MGGDQNSYCKGMVWRGAKHHHYLIVWFVAVKLFETQTIIVFFRTTSCTTILTGTSVFSSVSQENIMFAKPVKEGEVGSIKLIDFGLCCPFRPGAKITRAAGTPYSVAPELVTPPVQYDQRCDSWSAGVVMFIVLSGQYPFHGKTKARDRATWKRPIKPLSVGRVLTECYVCFLALHIFWVRRCTRSAGRTFAENQERTCKLQEPSLEENHQRCKVECC